MAISVCLATKDAYSLSIGNETEELTVKYVIRSDAPLAYTDAETALIAQTPDSVDGLLRRSLKMSQTSQSSYTAELTYSSFTVSNIGEIEISGTTGGGTMTVTHALNHIASYPATGQTAPNHQGAINVTDDGVEGTTAYLPTFAFDVKKTYPTGTLTDSYLALLAAASTTVNLYPWRNFRKGELLLRHADFSIGMKKDSVTYHFEASPSLIGLKVPGGITIAFKEGWHFLWYEYELNKDDTAGREVRRPICAHVEQIYQYSNFALLGL